MPQTRVLSKDRLLKRCRNNTLRFLGFVLILLSTKRGDSTGGPNPPDPSEIKKRIQSKLLKILVVDDDPKFRRGLCFNLQTQYKALANGVGSGDEAIERARTGEGYDLIMLDLKMGGKNGIETYKELAGIVHADCKFALMSSWPGSEEWDEASKLKIVLLQKPIPTEQLRELLNDCVGGD